MITVKNIYLPVGYSEEQIKSYASKALKVSENDIENAYVKRISIDARKKSDIHYTAMLEVSLCTDEQRFVSKFKGNAEISTQNEYSFKSGKTLTKRPVIVGSGPAGLFCALLLARNGARPIIIERGEKVEDRTRSIEGFFDSGKLNTESNIQFGEGGAGTFSDGKLTTGTKDIRSDFIKREFAAHGAPRDILISAKAHIGTDMLKITIRNIRLEIESLGGEFRFNTRFTDFNEKNGRITGVSLLNNDTQEYIETDNVVLAIGHSARDTFEMMKSRGIAMEQKPFSIGVRIEHSRDAVDDCQYGKMRHLLPAADYKLSTHLKDGRGVYTFCMCPGGYVVNASSEDGMLCTNGMSLFARAAENSNSAVLVSVSPDDYNCGDVLDGIRLQRNVERAAFKKIGGFIAPVQTVGDFLGKCYDRSKTVMPSIKPGFDFCDISDVFPGFISESLRAGLYDFGNKMNVFKDMGAVITASETRSSSPVRIVRDNTLQSVTLRGLYPCGEGAGYAGGIMSAAADGLKCAEKILLSED